MMVVGCSTASGPISPPPAPQDLADAANVTAYRDTAPVDDASRMVFTINGSPAELGELAERPRHLSV